MKLKCLSRLLFFMIATLGVSSVAFRNVVYLDDGHPYLPTASDAEATKGITHVIVAFADPQNFTVTPVPFKPFMNVSALRPHFDNGTQIGLALGGWGDYSSHFSSIASSEGARNNFSSNLASWLKQNDFDFVDVDWEYPGGNGADYKTSSTRQQAHEIGQFPLFLQAIKSELKKQQVGSQDLSVAVAGTAAGMLAFPNATTAGKVWDNVDFVNVMAYDFVNRRDNASAFHTDVATTAAIVNTYLGLGLRPEKINLGFAYYAKYFELAAKNCTGPLGCPIVFGETADGADNGRTGTLTFETQNIYAAPLRSAMATGAEGACSYQQPLGVYRQCEPGYCCSANGFCGATSAFCQSGCQPAYGTYCNTTLDVQASFQRALRGGKTDQAAGGQWYIDAASAPALFWTWETTALMRRKWCEVVAGHGLGGVMAWSLGEDSGDWSHLAQIRSMINTTYHENSLKTICPNSSVPANGSAHSIWSTRRSSWSG
ncbi:glycoside hydrolase superfamily [Xylariaceae sp. FL0804]|nr:glycoside hydrolase superfamily [Xylariaceae sp. FL0804]